MTIVAAIMSGVCCLVWLPIAGRFVANWQRRKSPSSVSIAMLAGFMSWSAPTGTLALGVVPSGFVSVALSLVSLGIAAHFYSAFRDEKEVFKGTRDRDEKTEEK